MDYIPNLRYEEEMLAELGLESIDDLFSDIPGEYRIDGLDLPDGIDEMELARKIGEISSENRDVISFLGAGIYNHYVPAAVRSILSRSEFYTSYTPYQPEVSQGMLQATFEYQSMIAELTGMEVANASMYDGATALAEAALMCTRLSRATEFFIPAALCPSKKSILDNYCKGAGITIHEVPMTAKGTLDLEALQGSLDACVNEKGRPNVSGVYVENPNVFGIIDEGAARIREMLPGKAQLVVGIYPIALGLLTPPGEYGADVVVGEGQCLGNAPSFGGPLLGIFACTKKAVRKMPGRVIGATVDAQGERAFAMTLQTREQFIRREKATSNICSNESLNAIAAGVYMAMLGKTGLRKLAMLNLEKAHAAAQRIDAIDGFTAPYFDMPFFNEFVVESPVPAGKLNEKLLGEGIQGGLAIGELPGCNENLSLWAFTETITDADVDKLISALESVI